MSYRLVRYSHNQLDDLFKLAPFSVGFDNDFVYTKIVVETVHEFENITVSKK